MPYLDTAQQWLTQSAALLQARPTTTRITTKYNLLSPPDPSSPSKRQRKAKPAPTATDSTLTQIPPQQEPVRAALILKTYDPESGTTLKYSTNKAAEVSRLIQILGKLGRGMAGLPEVKEDVVMAEPGERGEGSGVATPVVESASKVGGAAGGQGGSGKKKKGKGKK